MRYISGVSVPCPLVVWFRRYLCVSPPLASGTRPLHLRFVRSTPGSCPVVTRVYRTSTETQRTATEDERDEYRTERPPTYNYRTRDGRVTDALVHSLRWKVLNMFKTCHRTERTPTDINGQVTYSPEE